MDFEDFKYDQTIPPGLTKKVVKYYSKEAGEASLYYDERDVNGSPLHTVPIDYSVKHMEPRIEIRIVGFDTDESERPY
jgi:hypothetical protein